MNLKFFFVYVGLGLLDGLLAGLFVAAVGLPQWVQLAAFCAGFGATMLAGSLVIVGAE